MTFGHIETVMTFIVANVTRPSVAFQASGPPALPPTVDRWVTGLQYISRRSVTDEGPHDRPDSTGTMGSISIILYCQTRERRMGA